MLCALCSVCLLWGAGEGKSYPNRIFVLYDGMAH